MVHRRGTGASSTSFCKATWGRKEAVHALAILTVCVGKCVWWLVLERVNDGAYREEARRGGGRRGPLYFPPTLHAYTAQALNAALHRICAREEEEEELMWV